MTFDNIDYLQRGNDKQKAAFRTLMNNQIIEKLRPFSPLLTGTIPINIDTEESDLDIICCWKNKVEFVDVLIKEFENLNDFTLTEKRINNFETIVATFNLDQFKIEIFGQNRPTKEQESFKHMMIEYEILKTRGESFRLEIIRLKKEGLKTEPAFGKLLGLEGNPYEELLNFKLKN